MHPKGCAFIFYKYYKLSVLYLIEGERERVAHDSVKSRSYRKYHPLRLLLIHLKA